MLIQGVARRYVLIDINAPKCRAEVLDLNHGLAFVPAAEVVEGTLEDVAGSDIVVIAAGAKQKPGQTRLDLAATNAAMLRGLVPAVVEVASQCILLLITNPVDVLTMVTHDLATPRGFESARILGSGTVLDTARFRFLLAQRLDVAIGSVHASIAGEHGESAVPLWSSATVGHTPLHLYEPRGKRPLNVRDRVAIFQSVRGAAAEIIVGKGATNSAIGLAASRICQAILEDERAVLSVSSVHEDLATIGLGERCAFSMPTVVGRGGVERVVHEVPLNDAERAGLAESARVIREAYERVSQPPA